MKSNAVTQIEQSNKIDPEPMIASLRDLVQQPKLSNTDRTQIQGAVIGLTKPATAQWISGRAATTLAQYFTSPMPDKVMHAIAQDWIADLREYPQWALEKAFRWWIGRENERRRNKPLPGDISDRAYTEMSIVRAAEIRARSGDYAEKLAEGERQPVDGKTANKILEQAGFAPKRFGGDA